MWPFVLALISSTRLGGRKDTLYSEIKAHVLPLLKENNTGHKANTNTSYTHAHKMLKSWNLVASFCIWQNVISVKLLT